MAIQVQWDNPEKTVIYYTFEGRWTFKDFNGVYQEVFAMLDTVNHPVHAIVDLSKSPFFPTDTLSEMRRLTFEQHRNGGITVIITQNHMAHAMYNFLRSVYRRFSEVFHLVNSQEAAYQVLEQA